MDNSNIGVTIAHLVEPEEYLISTFQMDYHHPLPVVNYLHNLLKVKVIV